MANPTLAFLDAAQSAVFTRKVVDFVNARQKTIALDGELSFGRADANNPESAVTSISCLIKARGLLLNETARLTYDATGVRLEIRGNKCGEDGFRQVGTIADAVNALDKWTKDVARATGKQEAQPQPKADSKPA